MRTPSYTLYLDHEVLTASPLRLVQLLYRGSLDSIAAARRYLKLGDIRSRSRAISKAQRLITELSRSLNVAEGGEVGQNLSKIYAYVLKLLITANTQQLDPPLEEAERLVGALAEAWEANSSDPTEQQPAEPASEIEYEPLVCSY